MNTRGLDWVLDGSGVVGLALLAVGLLLGASVMGWTVIPLILIGLGVASAALWLLSHRQLLAQVAGLRSTQTNTNIVVSAIAFLVILVLVNGIVVRFDRQFDLSEDQLYSLSPQTEQVMQALEQPIKVWWVSTNPAPAVRESLDRYQRLNPEQFEFELLDPRRNPAEARRLGINRDNVLLVEAGERQQELAQPSVQDLESQLTPLILKVIDTESLTAYFLQGHGELPLNAAGGQVSLSQARQALEQDGFTVAELNLLADDEGIPTDGVVLSVGPERGFLPGEVEKLQTYLQQGGKLGLFLNPQTDVDLDALLEDWGIELGEDVVVDRLSEALFRSGPLVALGAEYGAHPITADLSRQQIPTLFPLARSITAEAPEGTTATVLVRTGPQGTWGETDIDLRQGQARQPEFDPDEDTEGPLSLAVALSREVEISQSSESEEREEREATETAAEDGAGSESESEEPATEAEARLVVFGNTNFLVNGNFNQQGNADLFLNSVNWLAEQGDRISLRPKTPTNRRLTLTQADIIALGVIAVLGLPLLALTTGIAIWWQRR